MTVTLNREQRDALYRLVEPSSTRSPTSSPGGLSRMSGYGCATLSRSSTTSAGLARTLARRSSSERRVAPLSVFYAA